MSLLTIRILLFSLVPIGIFIFIKALLFLIRVFNGTIVCTTPFGIDQKFHIDKDGYHGIWIKGSVFKRTPLDKHKIQIIELPKLNPININHSIMRPQTNNFSTGRMEIFTFYAEAGDYELRFEQGSSLNIIENSIAKFIPSNTKQKHTFLIEIRTAKAQYQVILSIPLMLIGIGAAVLGLVFGILAPEKFNFN